MVSDQEYMRHEILEIVTYLLIGLISVILIPNFIGFFLKGFEESFVPGKPLLFNEILVNYQVYTYLLIGALLAVLFAIVKILTIRKGEHPATQENPNGWRLFSNSFIFDPENGALYTIFRKLGYGQRKNWFRWTVSFLRIFIISIIVFGILGLLILFNTKLEVVGIPGQITQQITPFTQIAFTAEPASFAETGTMLVVFMFLMGCVSYFTSKFIKNKDVAILVYFLVGFFIVCPIMGLAWTNFHNIVYSDSAKAQYVTFFFGWFGSTMTLLFGTFLVWYILHYINNIASKLNEIAPANADIKLYWIMILVTLIISYVSVEYYVWRYKKKHPAPPTYQEPTF